MSFQSGPVTEAQANASIIPDGELFVCRFVDVAYQITDAHSFYAVLAAYSMLAATTPSNLALHDLGGDTTLPNFWGILIGPSGDRKSHVVKMARTILTTANPGLVANSDPGSEEAFFTLVAAQPTQWWPMLEMGRFLSATEQKHSYLAKIKPLLIDLYDGESMTRTLRKETYSIVNPRVSVLAAVNPPFLGSHSTEEDWTAGLLSRFAFAWAVRERTYHINPGATEAKAVWYPWLSSRLSWLSQQKAGPYAGIEPEALRLYEAWCRDFEMRTNPYVHHLGGQRERIMLLVRKIALLNAWDTGLARSGQPWMLRAFELESAFRLGELCWQSVMGLSYLSTKSKDVRDRRAIISVLNTTEWMSAGAISRAAPEVGLKRRREEVLDTLVEERSILKYEPGGQASYRLPTAQEVEQGGPDLVASHALSGGNLTASASAAPSGPAEPKGQVLPFPLGG